MQSTSTRPKHAFDDERDDDAYEIDRSLVSTINTIGTGTFSTYALANLSVCLLQAFILHFYLFRAANIRNNPSGGENIVQRHIGARQNKFPRRNRVHGAHAAAQTRDKVGC